MTTETIETILLDILQEIKINRRVIIDLEKQVMGLSNAVEDLETRIEELERSAE